MRPTLRRFYQRIDLDHGDIDEAEIRAYLRKIGVGDGLFGNRAVDEATAEVLRLLDASGDRKVQWEELVRGGAQLLPRELIDAAGHLDRNRVADVFAGIVKKKKKNADRADARDLARYLEPELRRRADTTFKAMFAAQAAAAAAKIGIDALAADDGKTFSADDLFAIVDDINREIDRLPR
jgi:hypothetical protein